MRLSAFLLMSLILYPCSELLIFLHCFSSLFFHLLCTRKYDHSISKLPNFSSNTGTAFYITGFSMNGSTSLRILNATITICFFFFAIIICLFVLFFFNYSFISRNSRNMEWPLCQFHILFICFAPLVE